ncbi:MAG: nucleoside 2-deoxyribosyltransferase [Armatimonadetes bacterium]|nr:nucleoside 2-deoxyribosyltransferase [Akkermansiaceae bacterium]
MTLAIVGGTYLEFCQFPEWNEIYGSGLRAAVLARALGSEVIFHTIVGEMHLSPLKARAANSGFTLGSVVTSPKTIAFSYTHGFSTPDIFPPSEIFEGWGLQQLKVESDVVLRFGLIEGDAQVRGKWVVYDPQDPLDAQLFSKNGSKAEHLAVICNLDEGRKMTGKHTVSEIIHELMSVEGAEAIVLKMGSRGAFVYSGGAKIHISAYETTAVWPLGSGDVFGAAFAHYWGIEKRSPEEAAELASKTTAHYCETKILEGITIDPCDFNKVAAKSLEKGKVVYLAGPFFSMSQIWLINEARAALRSQGFTVFSPMHDVGRGPASEIYEADIDGIRSADVIYACVDGLDTGTIYEIGFAKALGKPVVVFVQNEKEEDLKMLKGGGCEVEIDFVTSIYRTSWIAAK